MLTNNKGTKATGISETKKRKKSETIFSSQRSPVVRPKLSFNEQTMMQVIKCFAKGDFNTLENYFNLCNKLDLEKFFSEAGNRVLDVATLKANDSAMNFIVEKISPDLAKAAMRAQNYEAIRSYLYGATDLEESGEAADEKQRELRRKFFNAWLKIDKEGITALLDSAEPLEEIANLTPSIKEDFNSVRKSMDSSKPESRDNPKLESIDIDSPKLKSMDRPKKKVKFKRK